MSGLERAYAADAADDDPAPISLLLVQARDPICV